MWRQASEPARRGLGTPDSETVPPLAPPGRRGRDPCRVRVTQGGGAERREPHARRLPGQKRMAERSLPSAVVRPTQVPGDISDVREPVALHGEDFGTQSTWSAYTSRAPNSPTEDRSSVALLHRPSPTGSPTVAGCAESLPARRVRRVRGPGASEHHPAWQPPEGSIIHDGQFTRRRHPAPAGTPGRSPPTPGKFDGRPRPDCLYAEIFNRWVSRTRDHTNTDLTSTAPEGFTHRDLNGVGLMCTSPRTSP
ncbi:hypothetical protein [Streptomyces niveiscabiei]|uniref:hypothetical protein n=1 Tax=Streptomyces niveiscabiei TaxID=164115 RepID=UPI00389AE88E